MSVAFKKVLRKNPQEKQDTGKYYPQLIVVGKPATLDSIAAKMKETSSLSTGDKDTLLHRKEGNNRAFFSYSLHLKRNSSTSYRHLCKLFHSPTRGKYFF